MVTFKPALAQFHIIAPGDCMQIWWPSAATHVSVTVLAVTLRVAKRFNGGHYVHGADFIVYNPHSYVYESNGYRKTVKRVARLSARYHSDDVRSVHTPEAPLLTPMEHATLLGYHAEHGGPEGNCVVPDEVLTACR